MPQAKYGSKTCKQKVWDSAKPVRGKDPKKYRQDPYGTQMCWNSYGTNGAQSWQVDHIKPASRGGSDNIRNLQALNSHVNMSKGNSLVKKSRHSKSNK